MEKIIKKHLPEIVALTIPLVFILGVIIYLNLPNLTAEPEYDFLFASHDKVFTVNEVGHLIKNDLQVDRLVEKELDRYHNREVRTPEEIRDSLENRLRIYRYHLEDDQVKELSPEEAQQLELISDSTSPDGYTIIYRHTSRGLFNEIFDTPRANGYYLTNNSRSRKLDIRPGNFHFSRFGYADYEIPMPFIGWVAKDSN